MTAIRSRQLAVSAITITLVFSALPAQAQAPEGGDPTVVAPQGGALPGRLTRPSAPRDDGEAPGPPSTPGTPPTPTPPGTPTPPSTPEAPAPPPSTPPRGASERVLGVSEIEPDINAIPTNFQEDFDPFDPPSNVRVHIDFREAELQDVVMWISALTGRNFIIADTINASKKITIISPQPVSIAEAYRAFLAALNMNGLTVVPFGRFQKIVEATGAERQVLAPSDSMGQIPDDDRMVTHIHQLQHVSIATVQSVIDALRTQTASIVPYEPTNTLIMTETGANLRRLLGVLETLDVPSGQEQIHIYQVRYAAAADLRGVLLEVFPASTSPQQSAAEPPRRRTAAARRAEETAQTAAPTTDTSPSSAHISQIISDERTNQLIVIANERAYQQILDLVGHLDVPIPGEGQIHVLFLENANSGELSSTLQSLTQGVQDMRADQNVSVAARDGGPVTSTFAGDISITADEATNSLVVVASLRDFLALRAVVDQLDRRRQQVYVEAVVMEVTLNRQNQLGIALHGGAPGPRVRGNDSTLVGATSVGGLNSLSIDPTSLMGLTVGLQGPALGDVFESLDGTILGGLPSIGAVIQAAQTDNNVNILSTPHILTMDNEEAEIVVGENIPFISGIGGGLGGLGALAGNLAGGAGGADLGSLAGGLGGFGFPSVSVQRQDVALTLRITPQINESNFVRLEIEQRVEDVQSIDPVLGPRTTTRQARTTVVVQDQQTIVIGGLMRDTTTEDISKVPFIGDIPIIGRLFRHTSTRSAKTNLLLLLTPYIIRDPSDFHEILRRKMQEREEFITYFGRRDARFVAAVDYARKDGPMQSMFEAITGAVSEEEARQRAFSSPTIEVSIPQRAPQPIRADFESGTPGGLIDASDATAP